MFFKEWWKFTNAYNNSKQQNSKWAEILMKVYNSNEIISDWNVYKVTKDVCYSDFYY